MFDQIKSSHSEKTHSILAKYKNIYVPKIFLMKYTSLNLNKNQEKFYLNYGYNFSQWKIYVTEIVKKFDELNHLVEKGTIRLENPENELEYLFKFPADYGGLGSILKENEYENLNFFDKKLSSNKNINFMSLLKHNYDHFFFLFEQKSNINKFYNNNYKYYNSSYYNYYNYPINPFYPMEYQNYIVTSSPNSSKSNDSIKK